MGRWVAGQTAATTFQPSPRVRAMALETALSPAATFTEGTTSSTLTSPKTYSSTAAGAPFTYGLSDTAVSGSYVIPYGATTTGGARVTDGNNQALTVAFDFDGQAVEIDINAVANTNFRVWANEQVSTSFGPPATNARKFIKVDFGSRAQRRIVVEFDAGAQFAGVVVAGTDTIMPPGRNANLKFAGFGDSYMFGYGYRGSNSSARSYLTTMGRMLGFGDIRRYGVASSGFLSTSPISYEGRISDILSFQPDIVLVQGSINDSAQTSAAVQTAATSFLTALKAGLPSTAKIVLTSPLRVTTPAAGDITITPGLSAAATAVGVPFIDATSNGGWFLGFGNIGATTGAGNSDYYQSNSPTTHPSPAGHNVLAHRLARGMAVALGLGL